MVRQTQTERLNFGVKEPITIANPGPYDWHVWRREPHGASSLHAPPALARVRAPTPNTSP